MPLEQWRLSIAKSGASWYHSANNNSLTARECMATRVVLAVLCRMHLNTSTKLAGSVLQTVIHILDTWVTYTIMGKHAVLVLFILDNTHFYYRPLIDWCIKSGDQSSRVFSNYTHKPIVNTLGYIAKINSAVYVFYRDGTVCHSFVRGLQHPLDT